jgi:putative redox protein
MADVITTVSWNGELRFTGTNAKGRQTMFDGNTQSAASPVEILLEALGACMAVDVVVVLEKSRTPAARIDVTLEGDRHSPEPRYLTAVRPRFDVWGDGIKPNAVARSLRLSLTKYCSVFHSLRSDLVLQASYRLHATGAEAAGEYLDLDISTPTDELIEPIA